MQSQQTTTSYSRYYEFTCKSCNRTFKGDYGIDDIEVLKMVSQWKPNFCDECGNKRDLSQQEAAKQERIRIALEDSLIPPERYDTEYDNAKGNIPLKEFVWHNKDKSLFITGENDTNKTWCVCAGLAAVIRKELYNRVEYWNFNDLANKYSSLCRNFDQAEKFKQRFFYLDLLVIDDIAKRSINRTAGEMLYDIIDKRYIKNNITWITSNFGGDILISKFENKDIGDAVVSRFRRMRKNGDLLTFPDSEETEKPVSYGGKYD